MVILGACRLPSLDAMAQDLETAANLRDFLQTLHTNLQESPIVSAFPDVRESCGAVLDGIAPALKEDADPETANRATAEAGETLLVLASQTKCTEMARCLLACGVKPDCALSRARSEGFEGVSPLMNAAVNGQLEMCRILVEAGADIERTCHNTSPSGLTTVMNGCTVLMGAAQAGHTEVVR